MLATKDSDIFKLKEENIILKQSLGKISIEPENNFFLSNYKKIYDLSKVPSKSFEILSAVFKIIEYYCIKTGIQSSLGEVFYRDLEKEAFNQKHELLGEIPYACQRLWTSALCTIGKEFCSILNYLIREDDKEIMSEVCLLCKGINKLCTEGRVSKTLIAWPKNYILYRGAGLPDKYRPFFIKGKKYRVPHFLATSREISTSKSFCKRQNNPCILYYFHVDKTNGCCHANYVDRTNVDGEDEFLFSPYSVFTVVDNPIWKNNPTWVEPHEVHLLVAVDNKLENEMLPLSPWH